MNIMDTSSRIVQYGLKTAFNYIEKNPEQNLPKLMDWVDKLAGDGPNSYPSPACRNPKGH